MKTKPSSLRTCVRTGTLALGRPLSVAFWLCPPTRTTGSQTTRTCAPAVCSLARASSRGSQLRRFSRGGQGRRALTALPTPSGSALSRPDGHDTSSTYCVSWPFSLCPQHRLFAISARAFLRRRHGPRPSGAQRPPRTRQIPKRRRIYASRPSSCGAGGARDAARARRRQALA